MQINYEKIRNTLKKRGMSIVGLCNLLEISRNTFWKWEKGEFNPPETKIRKLSDILNISVSEISDLQETVSKSEHQFGEIIDSWLSLSDMDNTDRQMTVNNLLNGISKLNKDLSQATIIIKALLSSLDIMFYIKDYNLNYVTVSESFLNNIGVDINKYSIKGKKDKDIFPEKDASINEQQDKGILQSGNELNNFENYIPGTRRKKWGLISKRPIFDKHRKIIGLIGTFIDITERKKSEEKKALLEKAIESMGPALTIFDINSVEFLFVNKKASEKQTGYPVEKFYGRKGRDFYINDFTYPEDRKVHQKAPGITRWPKTREKTYRIIRADGRIRWIQTFDSYVKLQKKRFIIGLSQDITENILARENTNLLQAALENSNQIIWQIEPESLTTVSISGNLNKLTGYNNEDFIDKEMFCFKLLSTYDKIKIEQLLLSKNFPVSSKSFNLKIISKTGLTKFMNCKFLKNRSSAFWTFLLKEKNVYQS